MLRYWLIIVLSSFCLSSCIDTELSLDVQVRSGSTTVSPDSQVQLELSVDVRVGEHALAGDDFTIQRASLFAGEELISDIVLQRPDDFSGRLEPGQSRTLSLRGNSTEPIDNAQALCNADVRVSVLWQAQEQPDDPLDPPIMSFGTAESHNVDVRCE